MDQGQAPHVFDRTAEDVGNIVEFGHVNMFVPDQRLATLFYVSGLGLTRDPFLMTGIDNMWINAGRTQFHLPHGQAQVLRGRIGLVLPDLAALRERLARVRGHLARTLFSVTEADGAVEVTCPWGNRITCHAAGPRWGTLALGIATVEIDAAPGTAAGIARFYREALLAPAAAQDGAAMVPIGDGFTLIYRETASAPRAYDGHHLQITLANFSGPHRWLSQRGLVTEESDRHQYRFQDVTDVDSGAVLATVEHEVRSMKHPLFARPLINRNPLQSNMRFAPGHEALAWATAV